MNTSKHPRTIYLSKLILSFLAFFTIHTIGWAQEENWDTYLAQYENGAGSTLLDMSLIKSAPKKDLPFLVITGVTYQGFDQNGFPSKDEFEKLYEISDNVVKTIASVTPNQMAGSFTYQSERLDYLYVQDTLNLRAQLTKLYASAYPTYKSYINIKLDKEWEEYLKFLYPNETTLEYMANSKVLLQLRLAGDPLEKPRPIDHWLYFGSKKDRDLFESYALSQKFRIVSKDYVKGSGLPYQLHLSRTDEVDPTLITELTERLRKKAKELRGEYDGWESVVLTN